MCGANGDCCKGFGEADGTCADVPKDKNSPHAKITVCTVPKDKNSPPRKWVAGRSCRPGFCGADQDCCKNEGEAENVCGTALECGKGI